MSAPVASSVHPISYEIVSACRDFRSRSLNLTSSVAVASGKRLALSASSVCRLAKPTECSLLDRSLSLDRIVNRSSTARPAKILRTGILSGRNTGPSRAVINGSFPVVPGDVQTAAALFTFATAFVVPFYTVMIFAPDWPMTKKLVDNPISYGILGCLYIYLLYLSWTPKTLSLMFASQYWLPELAGITKMFSSTMTVASAWIHLLAVDLFAGRQVFLDGLANKVETRHSLVLCLMFGPIGIICHQFTKAILEMWRKNKDAASNQYLAYDGPRGINNGDQTHR